MTNFSLYRIYQKYSEYPTAQEQLAVEHLFASFDAGTKLYLLLVNFVYSAVKTEYIVVTTI